MQVVLTISTIFRIHHEFPILIIWVKSIVFTLRGRFYCFFSFALCFPYDLRACLPKWSCKFMTKYIIMVNLLGHYYLLNNPSFESNPKHLSKSTSNLIYWNWYKVRCITYLHKFSMCLGGNFIIKMHLLQ